MPAGMWSAQETTRDVRPRTENGAGTRPEQNGHVTGRMAATTTTPSGACDDAQAASQRGCQSSGSESSSPQSGQTRTPAAVSPALTGNPRR